MNNGKQFKERVVLVGERGSRVEFSLLPGKALSQKWLDQLVEDHGGESVDVLQAWTNSTVGHFSSGFVLTTWTKSELGKWVSEAFHRTN